MKILVMGLPGSGKTTLASKLVPLLNAKWLNGDKIRKQANDWDFSLEGRKKQAKRMADLANKYKSEGHVVISDFICPTEKARKLFAPDILIWVDTITQGRFEDTNKMFVRPEKFDFRVTTKNAHVWAKQIADKILPLVLILIILIIPTPSFAYLGPGVGGGMIAATIGVIVAIFAALFGLIWFPVKRLLKKRKEKKENKQNKVD